MKTMLSYSDNQGHRFFATSSEAMNRFAAKQAAIETLIYGGSQQVRMDLLNRIGRGVYQSKDARLPYVVRVRQDGRAYSEHGGEEYQDFSATISDGRIISVHTGSLSAPSFEPDVDDDLAQEIFGELPE